jgi:hypothetical protein
MRNHTEMNRVRAASLKRARRKTAVITDDGAEIALVLLDADEPCTTGSRFEHRGRVWEIQGSRQGSRVLVAEPAEEVRQ